MTTEFKLITKKLNNENNTEKPFVQLGEFHTENKKWISTLLFDTDDGKLRLQLPSCYTKSGIIELSNRIYTDLLFDNTNENVKDLVNLILSLENLVAKELYSKSDTLFTENSEKISHEEFEDMITSSIRLFNHQTKVCFRVNIPKISRNIKHNNSNYSKCDIYNKKGEARQLSDIKSDTLILPLIEINELRITSTSINFHINLIECMILNENLSNINQNRRIQLEGLSNNESNTLENVDEKNEKEESNTLENVDEINEIKEESNTLENVDEINEIKEESNTLENAEEINEIKEESNTLENADEINELKEESNTLENVDEINELKEIEIEPDNDELLEIKNFSIDNKNNSITLKKPDDIYKDIYKAAILKANKLRQEALEAYLDAKKIKARFMLKDFYEFENEDNNYDSDSDN